MRNHFWSLVVYEYRKLFRRKMVWFTLGAMTVICIFVACSRLFGNSYVDGKIYESHREALEKDITFARALSGRALDDTLLKEMQEGYARMPDIPLAGASEEFEAYARPYKAIWHYVFLLAGDPAYEFVTEEEMYLAREAQIEQTWISEHLNNREKEYLRTAEEKVEKPFIYTYCEGWSVLGNLMNTICVLQLLLIAICIPPIFSEEHSRRTDQLIHCTALGKKPLYLAKLFVGVTFSVVSTMFLGFVLMVPLFCIYGTDGAEAALQLLNYRCVWPLTIGEAVFILLGLLLIVALFHTVLAMLLSEYFCSSTIPLAILAGIVMLSMFVNVPYEYRLLSQLWNMIPVNLVAIWGIFSDRLYPFFGTFLTAWQAAPCIYLLLGAGGAVLCFRRYQGYQCGNR